MTYFSKAGILSLLLVAAVLTFPPFFSGIFFGHDLIIQLNWSDNFTKQLLAGEVYPRWLTEMNGGRGSPAFYFYPPIPYYFTSLLRTLVFFDGTEWMAIGLASAMALGISGVGAFLWLQQIRPKNEKIALAVAFFYIIIPYHLAIDLYFRLAFAEFWAMAWMPWVLLFFKKIVANDKEAIVPGSIAYALLVMTHPPTTLIFSPVAVLYGVLSSSNKNPVRALGGITSSVFLGVGLASVYLFPALLTQDYVSFERMTDNRFLFSNNFLFTSLDSESNLYVFHLYLLSATMLTGVTAAAVCLACRRSVIWNTEMNFWALIAFISIFMMSPLSVQIWEILPVLQRIQFPWRFNVLLCVALLPLLVALFSTEQLQLRGARRLAKLLALILLIVQTLIVLALYWNLNARTITDEDLNLLRPYIEANNGAYEYFPRWVPQDEVLMILRGESMQVSETARVVSSEGRVEETMVSARKSILAVDAESIVEIELNRFYYPGWQARNEGGDRFVLEPTKEGYIRFSAPKGNYSVYLTLEVGIEERTGQLLSLLFVLLAIGVWTRDKKMENRNETHQNFTDNSQIKHDQQKSSICRLEK